MKLIIAMLLICSTGYANKFYQTRCAGCHMSGGEGKAGYSPKLAGQHWQYLRNQIRDIKLGRRDNGLSPIMQPLFKTLTDKEIEGLAKYIEKLDKK